MQDSLNPTTRVVAVLNFLAAHPAESFSLAEIARQIGLSNGSAHRILTSLAAAHYLARNDKQRTYSLGLAMVAIGQAAVDGHRGVDLARRELARLAARLSVQCSANTIVGNEILVLVKEGAAQSNRGLTRVGERRPLLPPLGLCHVAWAGEAAIDAYITRAATQLDTALCDHLRAAFPLIRQRGYAIAAAGARASSQDPAGRLTASEVQLLNLADAGNAGISTITAPVFSPSGEVALQLVMSGLPGKLTPAEIERHAERLCAAAAVITGETHGRPPNAG